MAKEKSVNPAQAHRKKEKEKALKKGKHHATASPTVDSLPKQHKAFTLRIYSTNYSSPYLLQVKSKRPLAERKKLPAGIPNGCNAKSTSLRGSKNPAGS